MRPARSIFDAGNAAAALELNKASGGILGPN